jgi:hypothetical protein
MMKRKSTFSFILILLALALSVCQKAPRPGAETAPAQPRVDDTRQFDPLELPRDKEIVPDRNPQTGAIEGSAALAEAKPEESGALAQLIDLPLPEDTVQSQLFRVQLLTSKVYGEARHAVTIAEEIFDQPVYLDYEVPYYKVRVGNFGDREGAEEYQMKAKAAGYPSCWVVVVNVGVLEVPPLYEGMTDMPVSDSAATKHKSEAGGPNDVR